jgi:NADPH-dependent glutamate synthase beta subunit-like oxidoreductase
VDDALSIQSLERYLADRFFDDRISLPDIGEKPDRKAAVVGGGPAGLACAYFLTLMGYPVTLFEAGKELGGIPRMAIPSYRLPRHVLNREIQYIVSLGVEIRTGIRIGSDLTLEEVRKAYDAVFLATGAVKEPELKVPGEKTGGVMRGLEFLRRVHAKEYVNLGQRVIVIGGGNAAVDAASTALRMGAQEVSLVCLEQRNDMPAWDKEIQDALEEGVRMVNGFGVNRVLVEDNSLSGVEFKRCTAVLDDRGVFNPQYDENELNLMKSDTVILSIGRRFDGSLGAQLGIAIAENDALDVHPLTLETSAKGVFAGGDAIDQPWTVSHAIGSAKRAAIAMDHYLRGNDLPDIADNGGLARTMREHLGIDAVTSSAERKVATVEDLNLAYVMRSPRHVVHRIPPGERIKDFREITPVMDDTSAIEEAKRCLSCGMCRLCGNCYLFCAEGAVQLDPQSGRFAVDYEYCKGCGVCQNECPCGYIVMITESEA